MLLSFLTSEIIKSAFPNSFYAKGQAYYLQKRVSQMKVTPKSAGYTAISAIVKGSKSYYVKIAVSGSVKKIRFQGFCSCPLATNCKHVVATLLAAQDQASPPSIDTQITPMVDASNDRKIDHWLQELNRMLSVGEIRSVYTDDTCCVCYVLSTIPHDPTALQAKLILAKKLKSGKLGSLKNINKTLSSHQKYLSALDRELLLKLEVGTKLAASKNNLEDYIINGAAGEKILPELIATGRCYWLSPTNPPLALAPTKQAELTWQMDENGFQELRYSLGENSYPIFAIDNIWYFDEIQWAVGVLETGLDKAISKILLSAPKIPPEQANDVTALLAKYTEKAKINRPKIFTEIKLEKHNPVPCLHLCQLPLSVHENNKYYRPVIQQNKPIAKFTFSYLNTEISWDDKRDVISQVDNDRLIRMIRDKQVETAAFDQLIDNDLAPISTFLEYANLNTAYAQHFLLEHADCDPLNFTAHTLPLLRATGWHITISPDYPYQIIDESIDEWYSAIEESSGHDWFGLELGITLNGEKINLLPVLQKMLKKMQENHQTVIIGSEPILAQLPDGRYIQLPPERVRNIINVLVELYDSESLMDDNILRLSKLHATRLLELEAALGAAKLRWFGGKNLRQLASKLDQFKGIKTVKVPATFQGQLRPYQVDGLSWLQFLREYKFGGILADDMGLGKTVQTLAHITLEKRSGRMTIPTLIVAPTSLMFNWRMEAERFSPHLKVLVLHGSERKHQFDTIANYDLILTTYPLLVRDKKILLKQNFYFLILDEAQFIKNSKSLATQITLQIKAEHRLCLTGTPMENHLGELWSLFHFMMPGLLGDEKTFSRLFRTPIEKQGNQERRDNLYRRISPFLLRRTKDKVVKELPEKIEIIRHVELAGTQRDLYETIRLTMQRKVRQEIAKLGLARSHIMILDALLKLRQVCCDPRLLKTTTHAKKKPKSAKLDLLMALISELLEEGRRILLFSQFTEMLTLIEHELTSNKITYVKLTGKTRDRVTPVQQFQNGDVPLFLISLKAGGTGLNLTAADTVIHYDPWWNPAVESQATGRAHRIGQNKTVFVYKFVTKGTVEEKILAMQLQKSALMEALFTVNQSGTLKLTAKDLQELFDPLEAVK